MNQKLSLSLDLQKNKAIAYIDFPASVPIQKAWDIVLQYYTEHETLQIVTIKKKHSVKLNKSIAVTVTHDQIEDDVKHLQASKFAENKNFLTLVLGNLDIKDIYPSKETAKKSIIQNIFNFLNNKLLGKGKYYYFYDSDRYKSAYESAAIFAVLTEKKLLKKQEKYLENIYNFTQTEEFKKMIEQYIDTLVNTFGFEVIEKNNTTPPLFFLHDEPYDDNSIKESILRIFKRKDSAFTDPSANIYNMETIFRKIREKILKTENN